MFYDILDIACIKLSAITSRASNKDYIDIYYVLQQISLTELLKATSKKFPDIDKNLILKSLVYFDDVKIEPIMFKNNKAVDFKEVKTFIKTKVLEYTKELKF